MTGRAYIVRLLAIAVLIMSAVACYARINPQYLEMAKSRVQIGDEREKVVQALSDAWYHADCTWEQGGWDYFLYGGRTFNTVEVIGVEYQVVNGKHRVLGTAQLDRPRLRAYIGNCIPESVFEQ